LESKFVNGAIVKNGWISRQFGWTEDLWFQIYIVHDGLWGHCWLHWPLVLDEGRNGAVWRNRGQLLSLGKESAAIDGWEICCDGRGWPRLVATVSRLVGWQPSRMIIAMQSVTANMVFVRVFRIRTGVGDE
jgi:hypothetical protein